MSKIHSLSWRAKDACDVSGVPDKTLTAWRTRNGFLNGARRGKTARFSTGDVAVLTLAGTLTRKGFNAPDAQAWAEKLRPHLEKALGELFELGRIAKRPQVTLEQEPDSKRGVVPILPVTFDLGGVCEWTVAKLGIPTPSPKPTTQEAKEWLARIASPEFAAKLAALKVEIDNRTPRTWTWADVERATGVPEWFALWALDSPRTDAFRVIERVRDDLPEAHA